MSVLLRITLTGFYIALGAMIFIYPQNARDYVNVRYKGFYQAFINETPMAKCIKGDIIANAKDLAFQVISGVFALIALASLFEMKKLFVPLSILAIAVSVVLHIPYSSLENVISSDSQIRKLIFIAALFCATLAFPCGPCDKTPKKSGKKSKKD